MRGRWPQLPQRVGSACAIYVGLTLGKEVVGMSASADTTLGGNFLRRRRAMASSQMGTRWSRQVPNTPVKPPIAA